MYVIACNVNLTSSTCSRTEDWEKEKKHKAIQLCIVCLHADIRREQQQRNELFSLLLLLLESSHRLGKLQNLSFLF